MHRWMIWLGVLLLGAMASLYLKSDRPDQRRRDTTGDWTHAQEASRLTEVPLSRPTLPKTLPSSDVRQVVLPENGRMRADGPAFEPVTQSAPAPEMPAASAEVPPGQPPSVVRPKTGFSEDVTEPAGEPWLGRIRESQPGFVDPNRLDVRVLPGGSHVLAPAPLPPYRD